MPPINEDEEAKICLDILKVLDDALQKGPWEKTMFLRGIGQKLRQVRDRFADNLGLEELLKDIKAQENEINNPSVQNPEVYISLYQTQGNDFRRWAIMVESLPKHSIGRPAYKKEEDAIEAIRAKEIRTNDAYVAVRVQPEHILNPSDTKPPVDRYGHEMLILKEGAVQVANIIRFVHVTGQYKYSGGMLVKKPGTEKTII